MAMEAVVFPQDPFGYYSGRELYNLLAGSGSGGGPNWSFDFSDFLENNQTENDVVIYDLLGGDSSQNQNQLMLDCCPGPPPPLLPQLTDHQGVNNHPIANSSPTTAAAEADGTAGDRPKRRRVKSRKNKEDIETQRMTHIAVERNRRKQMNEYLSVLRSLMPDSYVQRGDQASIIGGAINFVKELEQQLHLLGAQKHIDRHLPATDSPSSSSSPTPPFSECFTLPQYSTSSYSDANSINSSSNNNNSSNASPVGNDGKAAAAQTQPSSVADIEVTMVESHANMKIRSTKRPKQLLKLVSGLQTLRLTVLHLNVSTVHHIVLYSLSVKVEDDCKLTSVDEIASAVYQILLRIQEEFVVSTTS